MIIVYFLICLGASILGAVSGIGGGVIIKPLLDSMSAVSGMSVAAISFLSGCTVLSMTTMTLYRNRNSEVKVDKKKGTYLAIGAAFGGILGKQVFDLVETLSGNSNVTGAAQSFLLAAITFGVLIFTIKKSKITPLQVGGVTLPSLIGFGLGCISAFLGIGGGPINLAVLYLFFGMDTKTAALNSIYIIFFSQLASLIQSIILALLDPSSFPIFAWSTFFAMVAGGVLGGTIGPILSKKLSLKGVDKIFMGMVVVITLISLLNGFKYLGAC